MYINLPITIVSVHFHEKVFNGIWSKPSDSKACSYIATEPRIICKIPSYMNCLIICLRYNTLFVLTPLNIRYSQRCVIIVTHLLIKLS